MLHLFGHGRVLAVSQSRRKERGTGSVQAPAGSLHCCCRWPLPRLLSVVWPRMRSAGTLTWLRSARFAHTIVTGNMRVRAHEEHNCASNLARSAQLCTTREFARTRSTTAYVEHNGASTAHDARSRARGAQRPNSPV